MNTERSEKKVQAFLNSRLNLKRKIQTYEKTFHHSSEKIFFQLCPARELDWIDGWECDLVYTTTGYVEEDCIFTTPLENSLGPGLWIFTRYEPNQRLELVRVIGTSIVIHLRINLKENQDDTVTGFWHLTFTALDETGNAMIDSLPDESPEFSSAIDGLEHFLNTGELLTVR